MLLPGETGNFAKEPYRQRERTDAMTAYADRPSMETKAAFDDEQRRVVAYVSQREHRKSALMLAAFLVIDGVGIYLLWKYGTTKRTA